MSSSDPPRESPKRFSRTVSWHVLATVVISFIVGVLSTLFGGNVGGNDEALFSTLELIGFVLTVLISGASIVLAVAAIALGRTSEQAVITRSDESIRLQNEVFVKTTEALRRIESSTGVTEKRIEDIISGRVGDISRKVAEEASRESSGSTPEELGERIRKSLVQSLASERPSTQSFEAERIRQQEKEAQENQYLEKHNELLIGIGNIEDVKIERLSHGSPLKEGIEGIELFDGVFARERIRFAVSTVRPELSSTRMIALMQPLLGALNQLGLEKLYLVMFRDGIDAKSNAVSDRVKAHVALLRPEIAERIKVHMIEYTRVNELVAIISADVGA